MSTFGENSAISEARWAQAFVAAIFSKSAVAIRSRLTKGAVALAAPSGKSDICEPIALDFDRGATPPTTPPPSRVLPSAQWDTGAEGVLVMRDWNFFPSSCCCLDF